MNRRGFIGGLVGAASAMVLDPEKLLWVPGAKMISVPKAAVAPPRMLAGIRLLTGHPVYWDEVYAPVDCDHIIAGSGEYLRVILSERPTTYGEWIRIQGISKVSYSPSLAV